MLIHESGSTRQFELTPLRIRIGLAVSGVLLCLLILLFVSPLKSWFQSNGSARLFEAQERLKAVQLELKNKELALSVQEQRLKEAQESAAKVLAANPPSELPGGAEPEAEAPESGPPLGLNSGGKTTTERARVEERSAAGIDPSNRDFATPSTSGPKMAGDSQAADMNQGAFLKFDAKAISASNQGSSGGNLVFKLTKEQHDVRFAGYLFVYCEMADQHGRTKMYVYPESANLGDEDLPSDYKNGQQVTFNKYTQVDLKLSDTRPNTSLARVSVLLYSDTGKIVFQRGFEHDEIKLTNGKQQTTEGRKPQQTERRRAL